ncbi:GatB/YqeY domain-containing protein [bacterium]|nr:MAG: GatB/YqeY domain-containing protein [bacterium]
MALKDTISQDLKNAMKSGEKLRLETLRTIRAALMEKEIEKRGSENGMTPEDELGVLTTAVKRRKESIEQFQNGGRPELAEQERQELAIIQEYLPKQMSAEEMEKAVREIIAQTGASGAADFGKVMPQVMKQLKGKADGRLIQETVKKLLGAS